MKVFILCFILSICSAISSPISRYEKVLNEMNDLAKNNDLVSTFVLGKNDHGDDIIGIEVGYPGPGKTNHLVVGTHHGNELDAAVVPMEFANQALDILNDAGNPLFGLFSGYKFIIVPVLNIRGYNKARREERDANGKSHDPNRDYPDACVDKENFKLESTRLIAEFVRNSSIVAAVTVHGYIGTFTFPWGMKTSDYETPDHDLYMKWSKLAVKHNGYRVGTHGGLIYPATGSFEDWAYNELGIWTILLEIKYNANLKKDATSLIEFFAQVPKQRSNFHDHLGNCRDRMKYNFPVSRP